MKMSSSRDKTRTSRVQVEEVSEEELKRLQDLGFTYKAIIRTSPVRALFRPAYAHLADAYYTFKFRPDDVVLATYPKCGTTWTSELLWAMKNPDHLHQANEVVLGDRILFIDMDILFPATAEDTSPRVQRFLEACPGCKVEDGVTLQTAAAQTSPRIIKTHLNFSFLNPDLLESCKVVYVARNPKDVCVSYYHHFKNSKTQNYQGDFTSFLEGFTTEGPTYGRYWDHIRQAWERRDHPNLHIMLYEDMQKDILAELRKLAKFLELYLNDDQLERIADHANFDQMKGRNQKLNLDPVIKNFYRKGTTGDWANHASQDMDQYMNRWIHENSKDIDITFRYS